MTCCYLNQRFQCIFHAITPNIFSYFFQHLLNARLLPTLWWKNFRRIAGSHRISHSQNHKLLKP
jgi:hypothetical protein